jgi:hypothetical protein
LHNAILNSILLDQFGAFSRVLLEVAFVLELRAHVAGHSAIAASFSQSTRLACLFCTLALL